MPTRHLLYQKDYPINDYIRVMIPTVGEVLENEDNYYSINCELGHDYPFRYLRFRHCWRWQSPDVWHALYTA